MVIILGYIIGCALLLHLNPKQRKLNYFLMFLALTFVAGYRSVSFTGDNIAYAEYYILNSRLTISESFFNIFTGSGKDPFFYFLGNLFSKFGFTYRGWFVFIASIYNGGFFYLLYKRSKDSIFSLCFMICLNYFYFSMTGLRQAIAMGLLFIALDFVFSRKILQFIILVLVAAMFHSSALVFLPSYYLILFPIGTIQYFLIAICAMTAIFFPLTIGIITRKIAWNEYLAAYSEVTHGLSLFGFIIQFAVFILCSLNFFTHKKHIKENQVENTEHEKEKNIMIQLQYEINLLMAGTMAQVFAINIDNIFRISMYFSIVGALAIPNVLTLNNTTNRAYLKYGCLLLMFAYILRSRTLMNFSMFGEL